MKRLVLAVCALILCAATPARAQVFGQFTPAHPLPDGGNLFGAYLLLGENNVGLLGQLRFTSAERLNWGLQAGFSDPDGPGDAALLLGADLRYVFQRSDDAFPLDVAFGAAAGLTTGDNVTIFTVAPGLLYSHRFPLEGTSGAISPYGSLLMAIQHVNIDTGPGGDFSDTDVDLVARFGAEWEATRKLHLMAELQVGNGTDFNTGISIPF